MSASTPPPRPGRRLPTDAGSAGRVATRLAELAEPQPLESGAVLPRVQLAYETYGTLAPDGSNAILACHALSGDAHAAGWSAEADAPSAVDGVGAQEKGIAPRGGLGWWDGMIGPGKAFDTNHYFVICVNVLGSCRGSSGPLSLDPVTGQPYRMRFPQVTVGDRVVAQRALLTLLGVPRLLAVSGGSLGGMQALEWAVRYPDLVDACLPVASTARLAPMGVAWNFIAREAIMADQKWRAGEYDPADPPASGLAVARMVGHVTYLSAESLWAKFGRRLQDRDDVSYTLAPDLAVESYLRHQGTSFVKRFDANSYLYLSRAISYFDLGRSWGQGSLERAVERMQARTLLLSFSSDWLYPPADSQALETALQAAGKSVHHVTIPSSYGHDAFLLEEARQTELIQAFLAEVYQQVRPVPSERGADAHASH